MIGNCDKKIILSDLIEQSFEFENPFEKVL